MTNKILIVAYHYPPDASVGALRPARFTRYLAEHGWGTHVLTIKECFVDQHDARLLQGLESVSVLRTDYYRTPLDVYGALKKGKGTVGASFESVPGVDNPRKRTGFRDFILGIKNVVIELGRYPDNRFFWLFPALWHGYRLIRREKIRYIFATSPPFTVDLIAMLLAKLTGASLVVDHRDPWSACKEEIGTRFTRGVDRILERMVFATAAKVITTVHRYTEALRRSYPDMSAGKFVTITNGFDDTFENLPAVERDTGRFVMTYLGSFYVRRNPIGLLQALRELVTTEPGFGERAMVRFVGTQRLVGGVDLQECVLQWGLAGIVQFEERVPHADALRIMGSSDVLLLFAPDQFYQIPAKTYEYFAVRRPILAFAGEGATADMVKNYRAGLVVPQDDPLAIARAIRSLYRGEDAGFYDGEDVNIFSLRNKCAELAQLLKGLAPV